MDTIERKQMVQQVTDAVPHVGVIAALAGWLPPIAALFSILWISIQIAEKITGKPAHTLCSDFCAKIAAWWRRRCS